MFNESLPKGLPCPSPALEAHSKKLIATIVADINANGPITFARYMQHALYAPGLGYYSAGSRKFGDQGDFITAPELSLLFSQCVAQQCRQVLQSLQGGAILELGGGSGTMAAAILLELEAQGSLPTAYYLLEVSADLKQRQQTTLQQYCPHLLDRIHWLDTLPDTPFPGVIVANEVLDAMPVQRFLIEGKKISEYFVTWQQDKFAWHLAEPSSAELIEHIALLQQDYLAEADYYESEINMLLAPWLQSIAACLSAGIILLIDYGFPRHEYYHLDRSGGTLMCHYRHRAHADPLVLPGLQDITAHVDFTAVAESAKACTLEVAGYTTQAAFLLACGLTEKMAAAIDNNDVRQQLLLSQQIKKLTLPTEMGELFKVIALTKELDIPLMGFSFQDRRDRL